MLQVQYAAPNSKGTLAPLIGWIDFGTQLHLTQLSPTGSITNSMPNGYTISFDLTLVLEGDPTATSKVIYEGFSTPIEGAGAPFGHTAYTGIPGNIALYMPTNPPINNLVKSTITLSNIKVTSPCGHVVKNYLFIVADPETTNQGEHSLPEVWSVTTNGSPWDLLYKLPSVSGNTTAGPVVTGIHTLIVKEQGQLTSATNTSANAFITTSPTQLIAKTEVDGGREGFAFGIIVPQEIADSISMLNTVSSQTLNYVKEDTSELFLLPIHSPDSIATILFNNVLYTLNSDPLIITGSLGTYLFYKHRLFFIANTIITPILLDTFIITTSQNHKFIFSFTLNTK